MPRNSIPHEEVLGHIYEFLDYFGYHDTLIALQAESRVPYNTIHVAVEGGCEREGPACLCSNKIKPFYSSSGVCGDERVQQPKFASPSLANLERAVLQGSWAEVLNVYVDGLLIPYEVRANLYEVIFEELLYVHGIQTAARTLLQSAPVFKDMKGHAPARMARLQKMLDEFDSIQWEERNRRIGSSASTAVVDFQRQREGVLQQLKGLIHFSSDPFDGVLPSALLIAERCRCQGGVKRSQMGFQKRERSEDRGDVSVAACFAVEQKPWSMVHLEYPILVPQSIYKKISYSDEQAIAICCVIGVGGGAHSMVLLGRTDGVLDFMDPITGELVGNSVVHTDGVLALALDRAATAVDVSPQGASVSAKEDATSSTHDSNSSLTWVSVGYRDGWVKVYNVVTRRLVRRFPAVHLMGVTSLIFVGSRKSSLMGHRGFVVTGSYDAAIHVLDIASGTSCFKLSDPHHGSFINALCPLPRGRQLSSEEAVHAVMSAGNDGMIGFWEFSEEDSVIRLLGRHTWNLVALHHECKDGISTALQLLSEQASDVRANACSAHSNVDYSNAGKDFVILVTRSNIVLILSIELLDSRPEEPVHCCTLCVIHARKRVQHVSACMCWTASLPVPMLCMYTTDEEGTVALYNIEMNWLNAEFWSKFSGALKITRATDESTLVLTDVGKAVSNLRVCGVWRHASHPILLFYAPSLSVVYVLQ